jgi:RNA polymerase sigma factor (sigma-70 family)
VNLTWVYRIAMHKAVDAARRKRRSAKEIGLLLAEAAPVHDRMHPELPSLLHSCVAGLPDPLRRLYFLRFEAGLSQRETAERLGLSRKSVRGTERRCIEMINGTRPR